MIQVLVTILLFSLFSQNGGGAFQPRDSYYADSLDIRALNINNYKNIFEGESNELYLMADNSDLKLYFDKKPIQTVLPSPSGRQTTIVYKFESPTGEGIAFSLLDSDEEAREIFYTQFPSWDVTSNVQWLGEDYLFFLRHCGSSCQGLSLLDVRTGVVKNATLSYQSFPDQAPVTYFEDWAGKTHQMEGFIKDIKSKQVGEKSYLVFVLEDVVRKKLSEEVIVFSPSIQ